MTLPNDTLRELVSQYTRLKQENQELRDELTRLRQAMRSLVRLQSKIEMITPQSNPYDLIHLILSTALEAVNSKDGSLMLLDEETNELVFVLVLGAAQKNPHQLSPASRRRNCQLGGSKPHPKTGAGCQG
jgi:hypothetical protein